MAPEGVAVYAARTGDRKIFSTADGREGTIVYLVGMAEGAIFAAEQLASAEVDGITYADAWRSIPRPHRSDHSSWAPGATLRGLRAYCSR
ncbi:MAG: hypothetical protein ABSF09_09365 [Candidatus Bathyarchaeia archaeon]|jgi:hypothetical protein